MPKANFDSKTRFRHFRAALALTGMTAERFAEQQGVTPSHLSLVLGGKRESRTLTEKIDAFIEAHVRTPKGVSA